MALTEDLLNNVKATQNATRYQSTARAERGIVSNTPEGKTRKGTHSNSPSPSTRQNVGSLKRNMTHESVAHMSERTCSNTRAHSPPRSREVVHAHSPRGGVLNAQSLVPISVPSSSASEDEDATTMDGGNGTNTSLEAHRIGVPPHARANDPQRPKSKHVANALGKALAKERAKGLTGEDVGATELPTTAIATCRKVRNKEKANTQTTILGRPLV